MLDEVLFDISPDGTYQLVASLLLQLVRGEGRRVLPMKVHVSVLKREEVRTHVADAGRVCLDRRAGDSGSVNVGSPIYRLVS